MNVYQSIDTAPRDGTEIIGQDADGREAPTWYSREKGFWRSGGIEHGDPIHPKLDNWPWVKWRSMTPLRIVPMNPTAPDTKPVQVSIGIIRR